MISPPELLLITYKYPPMDWGKQNTLNKACPCSVRHSLRLTYEIAPFKPY